MGALALDELTWPEVRAEIANGRDTLVLALGATEQHGPHLPLGTDALIGDATARAVAERLDAFVAPTVRVGCSEHHLAFAGTLSISTETFAAIVRDLVAAVGRHGFARLVLLPTHGGNFGPLAAAMEGVEPVEGLEVVALTDLSLLTEGTAAMSADQGVSPAEAGVHAGEWETSLLLALHPELVRMERAEEGYTGDLALGLRQAFGEGIDTVADNGVIGDPRAAQADSGSAYLDRLTDLIVERVRPR
jgi:creatinine amidohydrolase/Fe(II)-dependent formamide hydrolase-like protein